MNRQLCQTFRNGGSVQNNGPGCTMMIMESQQHQQFFMHGSIGFLSWEKYLV